MRRPRASHVPTFAALLLLAVSGCSDAPTVVTFDGPVDLTLPWEGADPEAVGMDKAALARAVDRAERIPRFRSLIVVRRGRVVVERYFAGGDRDELADVRSVTKSVVSTLTGLALDQGHLSSLNQPIGEILGSDFPGLDEAEAAISIGDLLTMSGGWAWQESGAQGYNDWISSGDHIGFLLERPLAHEPGTTFAYNSAAVHLLGVVLEKAVGTSLPLFAGEHLFGPLGVGASGWETLEGNHVNGGSGLSLRPRDLARVGQLFLQDGWSGDHRVLPPGWVAEATTARYPWRSQAGGTQLSYGYLWWTDEENDAFLAWGYGGQFIYVAPARELVVVATTQWWQSGDESIPPTLSTDVLNVIVTGVLPSAPAR